MFAPVFLCALNDFELEPCMYVQDSRVLCLKFLIMLGTVPHPTIYGPLSYGNHTVTVQAISALTLEAMNITHQGKNFE